MIRFLIISLVSFAWVPTVQTADDFTWKTNTLQVFLTKADESKGTTTLDYMTNDYYYQTGGPLLIHLTYGAPVKEFSDRFHFLFDIAQQLKALVIVMEHRYFAGTMPSTFEYVQPNFAMDDVTALVTKIKNDGNVTDAKIVLSGVGYAGLLAAWIRKQDTANVFYASIISNAPLNLFKGGNLALGAKDAALKSVYKAEGCDPNRLHDALQALYDIKPADTANVAAFRTVMGLVEDDFEGTAGQIKDVDRYLRKAFVGLAEQNLDLEHKWQGVTYPAKPVQKFCASVKAVTGTPTFTDRIQPLKQIVDAFYQKAVCFADSCFVEDFQEKVANFLECGDVAMYTCSLGPENDIFKSDCTDETTWKTKMDTYCQQKLRASKPTFNADYVSTKGFDYSALHRVVFIDSELDPFSVGGNTFNGSDNEQYHFMVPGNTQGAHFDQPNSCDSITLKNVRFQLVNILNCWVGPGQNGSSCNPDELYKALPPYKNNNNGDCKVQLLDYPWGQDKDHRDPAMETTTTKGAGSLFIQSSVQLIMLFGGLWLVRTTTN